MGITARVSLPKKYDTAASQLILFR